MAEASSKEQPTGASAPDQQPRASRRPTALRHPGFRQLARAWFFTNVADSALFLLVAVWVKDLTGSDTAASLVFATLGLAALASPFMGQLADRLRRQRLLVVANALMAPTVLMLLLVGSSAQLWLVYAVILAYGIVGHLTGAAQSGLVRDLLPDEELASGNGLLSTIDQSLRLLSPLIGTLLYTLLGHQAVVAFTAASFLVAAVLLLRLRVDESPPTSAEERGRYWAELGAGFRHLLSTPALGFLTVVMAVAFGSTGLVNVAIFPAMELGWAVPAAMLGVLTSVQGAGAVLGGLTAARCIARLGEGRTIAIGALLLALGCATLAGGSLVVAAVGMAVGGVGISWTLVAFITMRQRLTQPQLQGRVAAATGLAINLPQTLVTMAAAAIIGLVDYRLLIIGTAALLLATALLARPFRTGAPVA